MSHAIKTINAAYEKKDEGLILCLDIDETLVTDKKLNSNLINAIKEFGFTEIWLFTQRNNYFQFFMIYTAALEAKQLKRTIDPGLLQTNNLLKELQKNGLTKVKVSTSVDSYFSGSYYDQVMSHCEDVFAKTALIAAENRAVAEEKLPSQYLTLRSQFYKHIAEELLIILKGVSTEEDAKISSSTQAELIKELTEYASDKTTLSPRNITRIIELNNQIYPQDKIRQYQYFATNRHSNVVVIDDSKLTRAELEQKFGSTGIAPVGIIDPYTATSRAPKTTEQYLAEFYTAQFIARMIQEHMPLKNFAAATANKIRTLLNDIFNAYANYDIAKKQKVDPLKKQKWRNIVAAIMNKDKETIIKLITESQHLGQLFSSLRSDPTEFYSTISRIEEKIANLFSILAEFQKLQHTITVINALANSSALNATFILTTLHKAVLAHHEAISPIQIKQINEILVLVQSKTTITGADNLKKLSEIEKKLKSDSAISSSSSFPRSAEEKSKILSQFMPTNVSVSSPVIVSHT